MRETKTKIHSFYKTKNTTFKLWKNENQRKKFPRIKTNIFYKDQFLLYKDKKIYLIQIDATKVNSKVEPWKLQIDMTPAPFANHDMPYTKVQSWPFPSTLSLAN